MAAVCHRARRGPALHVGIQVPKWLLAQSTVIGAHYRWTGPITA